VSTQRSVSDSVTDARHVDTSASIVQRSGEGMGGQAITAGGSPPVQGSPPERERHVR
jgi:hypothetical protein